MREFRKGDTACREYTNGRFFSFGSWSSSQHISTASGSHRRATRLATAASAVLKGAVSAFWEVSQISKSFVWIDLILDKDYSDMHINAKIAILADL